MTVYWISQHIWSRRFTIHLGSCFMCNEGRGSKYRLIENSLVGERTRQWHGPFSTTTDAHAAADLLATHDRPIICECRHCMADLSQIALAAGNGDIPPPKFQSVMNMPKHEITAPEFWICITGDQPRATIHVNFCTITNRDARYRIPNHGTNVKTPTVQTGWYGPYQSKSDVDYAARQFQQAFGIAVRDCLRCARASRRHPLNAEIGSSQPSLPDVGEPAVPIDRSVTQDHITCLECGQRTQLLAHHLRGKHNVSPDDYRMKWNLPARYPMVSHSYKKRHPGLFFAEHAGRDQPSD
jgi:hypothetical protein